MYIHGLSKSPKTDAVHDEIVVCDVLDLDAERARPIHGGLCVAGATEAAYVGLALGERADQDGTVRDRLVAGHDDMPDESGGWLDPHAAVSRSCVP
jgi:hypothetical protein